MSGQFIRRLEPYGFPDQNKYKCVFDVDLSDLRADLDDLKDTDKTIEEEIADLKRRQSEINQEFARRIQGAECDIVELQNRDNQITEFINDIADSLSATQEDVESHEERITALEEEISAITSIDEIISGKVSNLESAVLAKADRCWVEENYYDTAHTYSKDEVDSIVEEINGKLDSKASIEYVDENFVTNDSMDSAISGVVNVIMRNELVTSAALNYLNDKDGELNTSINNEKERAESAESALGELIASLDGKHDEDIQDLKDKDEEIEGEISDINDDITYVSGVVDTKLSISEFNDFSDDINDTLDTFRDNLNDMNERKADKSYVDAVQDYAEGVNDRLTEEIERATARENEIESSVDGLSDRIDETNIKLREVSGNVDSLEDDLANEVAAREQGDLALIGRPNDASDLNTINAAKNYAKGLVAVASGAVKVYSDEQDAAVAANARDYTDTRVSTKADKSDLNAVKAELEARMDSAIEAEAIAREDADARLTETIASDLELVNSGISSLGSAITTASTLLAKITNWDGTEPYDDGGNGVLDVLHRTVDSLVNEMSNVNTALSSLDARVTALENLINSAINNESR